MASNTNNVTPSQIVEHRALRRRAGMVGCKDGSDMPLYSLKGISWRPADPMNPSCFCIDCRETWDADGAIDAELVNAGNRHAVYAYESLLRSAHPVRTMTEHPEAYKMGVPRETFFPPPTRSMTAHSEPRGWGQDKMLASAGAPPPPPASTPKSTPPFPPRIKIPPRADDGEIPFSLPAPRHRDIMNETRETRIKKDLFELLTNYRGEMILIMDSRRSACFFDDPKERDDFMKAVNKKENELWDKIHAAELLISSLDD